MDAYKALGQLRLNWSHVRPQLQSSNADERALSARFDESLHLACDGENATIMARQAPPLLAQVDELERIFSRRLMEKTS